MNGKVRSPQDRQPLENPEDVEAARAMERVLAVLLYFGLPAALVVGGLSGRAGWGLAVLGCALFAACAYAGHMGLKEKRGP